MQPKIPLELQGRLERMEQAIDSIAVEVERISEGQRFTTKLLERAPAGRPQQLPPTAAAEPMRVRSSIVDDEPNIRRMVGALLSGEGFEVRDAANGAAGVRAASKREPDAVLLDLMMPGELDGMAALGQLRERFPPLPVVMMSGRAGAHRRGARDEARRLPLSREAADARGVLLALRSALELRQARREAQTLREESRARAARWSGQRRRWSACAS